MSRLRPGRRTAAILAILLLLAVAGSDLLIAGFWLSHPMLTAIVSALVVVVLSVAVIEVVPGRRAERRWRVLAQTSLMELGEAASTTWRALAEVLDLSCRMPTADPSRRTRDWSQVTGGRKCDSGKESAVGIERRLAAEVGVQDLRATLDLFVRDHVDHPCQRLTFVDGVGDHPLQARTELDRRHCLLIGQSVGPRVVSVIEDDLVVPQVSSDID